MFYCCSCVCVVCNEGSAKRKKRELIEQTLHRNTRFDCFALLICFVVFVFVCCCKFLCCVLCLCFVIVCVRCLSRRKWEEKEERIDQTNYTIHTQNTRFDCFAISMCFVVFVCCW